MFVVITVILSDHTATQVVNYDKRGLYRTFLYELCLIGSCGYKSKVENFYVCAAILSERIAFFALYDEI